MTTEARTSKQRAKRDAEHREFLFLAYCGLVLRGYSRERDIEDPILRKVWRYGKRLKGEFQ